MKQLTILNVAKAEEIKEITDPDELIKYIEGSGCTMCRRGPWRDTQEQQKITIARGNPKAKIWLVSKSPGIKDGETGKPFSFGSGDKARELVREYLSLDPDEDLFWINTVFCAYSDDAVPTEQETIACSSYFERLVQLCKPEAFIAMGIPAFKMLCDLSQDNTASVNMQQTIAFESKFDELPVWPIYHTAALYKPGADSIKLEQNIQETLKNMQRILADEGTIAEQLGVSRVRINQLQKSSMRKLRWPEKAQQIEDFIDE